MSRLPLEYVLFGLGVWCKSEDIIVMAEYMDTTDWIQFIRQLTIHLIDIPNMNHQNYNLWLK